MHGKRPPGFDYNNSPYEMSQADLEGKVIAHSTMAGTVGVTTAANADEIYVGSLVIARSTVEAILRDDPDLVTIVAMGDGGKVRTDEDEQCALYMRNLLEGRRTQTQTPCAASSWPAIRPPSSTTPPSREALPTPIKEDGMREAALRIDSRPLSVRLVPRLPEVRCIPKVVPSLPICQRTGCWCRPAGCQGGEGVHVSKVVLSEV